MRSAKLIAYYGCLLIALSFLSIASPPQADIEKRINALLAQMTLEEKLGQLQQLDGHADGNFRPEHVELARKGLLGSTLNVRGGKERERASARGGRTGRG